MNSHAVSSSETRMHRPAGYVSPGADILQSCSTTAKKRPSRAGTRSISTLSSVQLERKRANDREAQRAIRQRTRDHIEYLERSIRELRGSRESIEKLVHATQQQNRQLQEENTYLRRKLGEAGLNFGLLSPQGWQGLDFLPRSVDSSSPTSAIGVGMRQRRSISAANSHTSNTRSSPQDVTWRSQHSSLTESSFEIPPKPPTATESSSLTAWESGLSAPSTEQPLKVPCSPANHRDQDFNWTGNGTSHQHHAGSEPHDFASASFQPLECQPPIPGYGMPVTPQSSIDHITPQNLRQSAHVLEPWHISNRQPSQLPPARFVPDGSDARFLERHSL